MNALKKTLSIKANIMRSRQVDENLNVEVKELCVDELQKQSDLMLKFPSFNSLKVIAEHFRLSVILVDCYEGDNLDHQGILLKKLIEKKSFIFSGGRFGYAGFYPVSGNLSFDLYVEKIIMALKCLEPDAISFNDCYLDHNKEKIEKNESSVYEITPVVYLVADTLDSVLDEKLIFKKATKRSGLSRSIKMAEGKNIFCEATTDIKILETWHSNCNVVRINELSGQLWDLAFLSKLLLTGDAKLMVARDSSLSILGGCLFFETKKALELFMMSTPREEQKVGVNHLLAKALYLHAFRKKIPSVNWQASNPPTGSLVEFKYAWNAKPKKFLIYSWKKDNFSDVNFIKKNMPDFFIFPYDRLVKQN